MEAKEKAKELVEKYKKETSYQYQEYAGAHYSTFEHDIDTIKQCALICVDEILNTAEAIGLKGDYLDKYWQEVKHEISLL